LYPAKLSANSAIDFLLARRSLFKLRSNNNFLTCSQLGEPRAQLCARTNSLNSGYYAACAGLRTQTQALEFIANNLANINTAGYRGQQPTFRSLFAGARNATANPLSQAINDFNVLGGTRLDLSMGNMQPTGNPLDVALEGDGFFAVQTAAGTMYTRNGSFQVSANGQLITSCHHP